MSDPGQYGVTNGVLWERIDGERSPIGRIENVVRVFAESSPSPVLGPAISEPPADALVRAISKMTRVSDLYTKVGEKWFRIGPRGIPWSRLHEFYANVEVVGRDDA